MKKLLVCLVGLILVSSLVLATGQEVNELEIDDSDKDFDPSAGQSLDQDTSQGQKGIHEPGTGLEDPESKQVQIETMNKGADPQLKTQQKSQVKAQDKVELQSMVQERKQQMDQEIQGLSEKQQQVYKNQNQVRLAVHSLLAMEDLTGGIGQQVSKIARDFDNSVQKTINAEEKIESKGKFARLFTGGDKETAEELEAEATQNQQKIQELKQLKEQCECEEELKQMMQEQIQNMEQEQKRLQELAQKEKQSKGMFGWIWK